MKDGVRPTSRMAGATAGLRNRRIFGHTVQNTTEAKIIPGLLDPALTADMQPAECVWDALV